jgi:hypothetical protein
VPMPAVIDTPSENSRMISHAAAEKPPEERPCAECPGVMRLVYAGQFATIYGCRTCGSSLTIPPPDLPDRSPDRA